MIEWLRRLRGALVLLALLGVFLYIFSLNFRPAGRMDIVQRLVVESMSPLVEYLGKGSEIVGNAFRHYVWLQHVQQENLQLKQQVAELQQKLTNYQEAYIANQRLRRLLDFKNSLQEHTICAQVVLHDLTGWFQTVIVDKGFRDHVAPNMAVVNAEGVVGRILDVSDHYSRVLLITDPASNVDALVQRTRVRGILTGKDRNSCVLRFVRANLDVQIGDLIITSGKDGIFPKGLRLGVVQGVYKNPVSLFQKIEVRPLVQLSALEDVLIVKSQPGVPASLRR